jgi:PhnB protein
MEGIHMTGPDLSHPIVPHLVVRGAKDAAAWYTRALGARVGRTVPVPGGKFMEIELRFAGSTVMIADEFPEYGVLSPLALGGTYGALHLDCADVDPVWARAIAAGAQVLQELGETFWGERYGQILDPYGHRWSLAQHMRDVPDAELIAAAAPMFGGG